MDNNNEQYQDYPNDIINVGRLAVEDFDNDEIFDECKFFKSFKPFDTLVINPVINKLHPIIHFIGYKSNVVGIISIISFIIVLIYIYNNKRFLGWIFLFFSVYTRLIDKFFAAKCLGNSYISEDFISMLLKLTIFIIVFIIIESSSLINNNKYNYCYIILFMLIIAIITEYHVENIIKNNINDKEASILLKIRITLIIGLTLISIGILLLKTRLESFG